MFLKGHMQNAYVTHDLDQAVALISERYGVTDWQILAPDMTVKTLAGEQPMVVRVGSAWLGGLNLELIQPVSGYVDHYVNMLPADKGDPVPRFHHISLRRDDEAPVSIKDAIPSLVFVYLDARATLGHYLEFTWKSPEAWKYVGWPEGRPVW